MSATPVGDWLRRHYPPNAGATHWLGRDGDPGCCSGSHPMCLYEVAFREGATAERERIRQLALTEADRVKPDGLPDVYGTGARVLRHFAGLLTEGTTP